MVCPATSYKLQRCLRLTLWQGSSESRNLTDPVPQVLVDLPIQERICPCILHGELPGQVFCSFSRMNLSSPLHELAKHMQGKICLRTKKRVCKTFRIRKCGDQQSYVLTTHLTDVIPREAWAVRSTAARGTDAEAGNNAARLWQLSATLEACDSRYDIGAQET